MISSKTLLTVKNLRGSLKTLEGINTAFTDTNNGLFSRLKGMGFIFFLSVHVKVFINEWKIQCQALRYNLHETWELNLT